jgi:hypothetical protein
VHHEETGEPSIHVQARDAQHVLTKSDIKDIKGEKTLAAAAWSACVLNSFVMQLHVSLCR